MKKSLVFVSMLALAVSGSVLAGEQEKCSYDTQVCLNYMANHMRDRGYAGVDLDPGQDHSKMTITGVMPGTPAAAAGLQAGDVLIAINGVRLSGDEEAMMKLHADMLPGKTVDFRVARDGKEQSYKITLAEMPDEVYFKLVGEHMLEHATVDLAQKE